MAKSTKTRFAVGAVADLEHAHSVIDALRAARSGVVAVSLLGSPDSLRGRGDHMTASWERTALALRTCPVSASINLANDLPGLPPLATITAAVAVDGVPLRTLLAEWMPARHAAQLEISLRKGRILLWIPLLNSADESAACHALLRHGCDAIQMHDFTVSPYSARDNERRVRANGWSARC